LLREIKARLQDNEALQETIHSLQCQVIALQARVQERETIEKLNALTAQLQQANQRLDRQGGEVILGKYNWNRFRWHYYSLAEELWGPPQWPPPPPREMPTEMVPAFTMDGRVPIADAYINGTTPTNWPLIYTDAEIDYYLRRMKKGGGSIYGWTDDWLREAFKRYPIASQSVAIMGSITAWYETLCIMCGGHPVTIEYNRIISRSARLKTMTVEDYNRNPVQFDAAISISSFEHDGLGQYGDPIDPDGDLKTMHRMKSMIRKGGLLYLAIPLGADAVHWNAKRVYGPLRFPRMIEGWDLLESFAGPPEELYVKPSVCEPVFVLRNV
jgi:hypothetical protein